MHCCDPSANTTSPLQTIQISIVQLYIQIQSMLDSQSSQKLMHIFPCDLVQTAKYTKQMRGKLMIFENKITFFPHYSQISPSKLHSYQLSISFNQIDRISIAPENEEIHIFKKNKNQFVFKNLYTQFQFAYDILTQQLATSQLTQNSFMIEEHSQDNLEDPSFFQSSILLHATPSWQKYRLKAQELASNELKLLPGHEYGSKNVLKYSDFTLKEYFDTIYTDSPYKPSIHFSMQDVDVPNQIYEAPIQFFLLAVMKDKDITLTKWDPPVPNLLLDGQDQIPSFPVVSQRELNFIHPTKLPFFGQISPKVTLIQKFVLIDNKEFLITTITKTQGIPYSDRFRIRGYFKVRETEGGEVTCDSGEVLEWEKKVAIISGKIEDANNKEQSQTFTNKIKPFQDARVREIQEKRKEQIEQQISQPQSVIGTLQQDPLISQIKTKIELLEQKLSKLDGKTGQEQVRKKKLNDEWIVILVTVLMTMIFQLFKGLVQ